jgi:hypothetical protein
MTRPILGYDASIVRTNTRMCDVFPRRAHRVPVDDSEHEVRFITQRIQNHIVLPSWITSGESRHVRDGVPWRAFIRADGVPATRFSADVTCVKICRGARSLKREIKCGTMRVHACSSGPVM